MAEGHPFHYNPGEAPTTGATSLLHTGILARRARPRARAARGSSPSRSCSALRSTWRRCRSPVRVGTRLGGPREGLAGGGLVALGGPVVWGYLYGSDIALFLFLALLLLDRWLVSPAGGSPRGLALAGALLALARPEGLPIGLSAGASPACAVPVAKREPWCGPACPSRSRWGCSALQRVVTGAWLATSVSEKALVPNYGLVESLALASKYGVDVLRGLLLGLYPPESAIGFARGEASFFFPPLALLLVLLAVVRLRDPLVRPACALARASWPWSSRSPGRTSSWASTSTAT